MDIQGPSKYGPSLFLCKLISKLKLSVYLVFPEYYKDLQETSFTDGPYFCEFVLTSSRAQARALFFLTCCTFLAQYLLLKCNCLGYPLKLIATQGSVHLYLRARSHRKALGQRSNLNLVVSKLTEFITERAAIS